MIDLLYLEQAKKYGMQLSCLHWNLVFEELQGYTSPTAVAPQQRKDYQLLKEKQEFC